MAEIKVPEYFPEGCKDEELKQYIKDLTNSFYPTVVASEMIRVASLIQLGQNELHNRQTQRMNKISRRISWISVTISCFSLIAILVFSLLSYQTNRRWEVNQLKLLNTSINSFDKINNNMSNLSKTITDCLDRNEALIKKQIDNSQKEN